MAQFRFRLQSVLEEREREERLRQQALAEARLRLDAEQRSLDSIRDEILSVNQQIREGSLVGSLDLPMLAQHRRYLTGARVRIEQQAQRITQAQLVVEAKHQEMVAAARARKSLETLRDTQKARWLEEQSKRERAETDEVSMQLAILEAAGARDGES